MHKFEQLTRCLEYAVVPLVEALRYKPKFDGSISDGVTDTFH
jgi:hypothetical protein